MTYSFRKQPSMWNSIKSLLFVGQGKYQPIGDSIPVLKSSLNKFGST